jgi:signal transduction histidine kinase
VRRSRSSILFASILLLSFALSVWWTIFQVVTSGELAAAGRRLVVGDIDGAAKALGAADVDALARLAARRQTMFASEGAFFALVMAGLGWLYVASVRREAEARSAQDRFLAGATHELKTPLATIVLLLESLRDDRVALAKRTQYLETGLHEAERLERGLDNVLIAAGLRTAPRAAHKQPGDLVQDVRRAVAAVAGRALASDVTIEVLAPATMAAPRDEAGLQLALRNLLDNAIKYSPAGTRVRVELRSNGAEATITVHDQGRGMDGEELANAFAPFWRGSDNAAGGTGLGLHLVQQLVAAHGGSVQALSEGRGKGSSFHVRLPCGGTA